MFAACVLLVVPLAAQTGIFDTVSVDSPAPDAVDIAGGIALGVPLAAEDGGVPERSVLFTTEATCPAPLAAYTLPFNAGGLLACLYAPEGAAKLGSAILGTSELE